MDRYGFNINLEEDDVLKISWVKSQWVSLKHDLEKAKYLESLALENYVKTVRSAYTVWNLYISNIRLAQEELESNKDVKEHLPFIEEKVCSIFFKNEDRFIFKIDKIIPEGYEGYYFDLFFSVNGEEYAIQIPAREKLTIKNFLGAGEGKFAFLHKTSSHIWTVEFSSHSEEVLAKKCKEYFDKVFSV